MNNMDAPGETVDTSYTFHMYSRLENVCSPNPLHGKLLDYPRFKCLDSLIFVTVWTLLPAIK